MPNYRNKKKNNNNNRNKNKNLNKGTSSSSVKQEIRIVESKTTTTTTSSSSGNEPNLPANVVVKNSYTSAKNSTVFENEEKNVNVDEAATTTTKPSILSSSALSNEEIDENASNVDIDTFSGSEDTAHKQSNYSSKFYTSSSQSSSSSCSHFKKSTEIEDHQRQLNRAVFNIEDSTLVDSVIRETFVKDSNSVKNSLKTGSANTKDASAESTADDIPPATTEKSIEKTRINESFSENVRNISKERSKSTESATEVIESNNQSRRRQFSSSSNEDSSKVIVQKVVVKNATTIPSSSEKVIVHQISKEDQSINEPKVIVHHEESSSSSTSHRASKNNGVDLSKKTSTKACESSTTQTLSFSNVRGQPSSRQIIYEPRKVIFDSFPIHQGGAAPSRGIIHQISKEDDKSKVIVHQISREDQQRTASSSSETVITQHTAPQTTDYRLVVHQISPSSPRSPEIDQFGKVIDHSIFKESFAANTSKRVDHSKISKPSSPRSPETIDHSGKVIDHSIFKESFAENISKRVNIDQQDRFTQNVSKKDAGSQVDQQSSEQPKKVVLIPIVQENSTQTSPLPSFTDNPLHSGLFKLIKDENSESSKKSEISQQTSSSPLSRSPVICFENLSKSFELNKENSEDKSKIFQEGSLQTSPTVLQPNRKSPQRNTDHLEPLRIPAFPINRVNKVIIHPIINEASGKPVFPYSEKSMETIDNSSKKIAKQILKEVSSELKSSYLAELTKHKIEEIHCEPVRTSFPVSVKNQASFRPGFFETNIHQKEINPLEAEVKVIVHKISKEDQKSEKSEDLHSKESNNLKEKVINHQISNEDQKSTETKPKSDDLHSKKANNIEKKVIVHQISQEESSFLKNLHIEETKSKISNQPISPVKSPESKVIDDQISQEEAKKTKDHPKVIVHQISRSPSFPLVNETNGESIPKVSVPSKDSFPLSSLKIDHPEQYNSKSTILEQKTINFKKLREESKLTQSSASPFAMSKMEDKKIQPNPKAKIINHPILQEPPTTSYTSFPVLGEKQKQSSFTSQPIFTSKKSPTSSSFPISVEKETHQTQYTSRPEDSQQKTIDLQSLRDSAEFRQSSSTMTSTFGLTEMEKKQKIIHQIVKEEPSSDLQKQSPASPAEKKKEIIHPIQKEEPSNDLQKPTNKGPTFSESSVVTSKTEDKTVHHKSLQESSNFSQTSSTKKLSSTETKISEDQPKEIIQPISNEKSANDLQNLQKAESKHVPKEVIHQIVKEDSDLDLPLPPPPPEVLNQQIEDTVPKVHKIVKEDSFSDLPLPPPPETLDHQISQDESISSSEGSVLTAILNESPRSISPTIPAQPAEEPKPKESSKEKSPKRSFFLAPLELTNKAQPATEMKQDLQMISPDFVKVINHPIIRQIEKPLGYRVESPQPEKLPMIVKKSKSFDDDDVVIQEMSDTSSAGDTDNPPVISEAESETDTLEACDDFSESPSCSSLVSVQTLPMDQESESKSSQDYKSRRQQNRAALETHFLPQFLAPNFLDSIKEENSDMSDSDRRSSCSDRIDPPPHHADLDDDVFLDPPKKANAVYPKSNLDFSKKHKHVLNVRSPKTSVIREEASPPSVVEAKIIDQGSIEESCSSWSTDLTPESEAAEVVYIDSASSSVSDLLELDYSQGQTDDVRIQTPTIDLESVNEMFATCQSNDRKILNPPSEKPPPPPPVNDGNELRNNINEQNLLPANNKNNLPDTIKSNEEKIGRKNQLDEIIFEKIETMSETQDTQKNSNDLSSSSEKNSIENNLNSCDSAIDQIVTSNTSAPFVSSAAAGLIENMESLREIVNASTTSSTSNKSELNSITDLDDFSKPIFMIGQPCSDHTFKCDTSSSSSCTSSSTTTTNTITTTTKILTLHDLSQNFDSTKNPLVSPNSTTSALDRQESLDSHNSDQSHSTNQSQCTAINQGSLPPQCDWNEFDASTDTTYVSESDTAAGLASSEASSPLTLKGAGHSSADETDSQTIRKLRSLCTEALASMPYGEEVLQELATVSKNIQETPYPLPDLPQIQDIQLSLGSKPEKSSVITLSQVPPSKSVPPLGQKFKSPPPPPVPEPPSKYDSWLGVPTESDPNVLVCLSPSQRNAVKSDSTADSLLDMHKKFVERRGYHEYTTKQVNAINQANNTSEAVKLSKIDSPPPPPLPPRPQTELLVKNPNGNTDINVDNDDDEDAENNHRLLAIIRDTHEKQQQKQTSMTSTSENISRRTADTNESGIHHTTTTPKDGEKTSSSGLDKEFSKTPSSVNKLTQESTFIGESNKSRSEMHYQSESEHSTSKKFDNDSETVMGMKFPTSDYFDSIFADKNKRFSNIETTPEFCSQILTTQPKRYSNIETTSFESKKCVENGKVLYDVSDSKREKISEGDQPSVVFPEFLTKPNTNDGGGFPFSATPNRYATGNGGDSRPQTGGDSENIMSAFKLNTTQQQNQQTTAAPPPSTTNRTESSPPAPPVPPLPPTFTAINSSSTTTTKKSTSTSESSHINRSSFNAKTSGEKTFDNFGQHAKEAASTSNNESSSSSSTKKPSENFQHEKLFKEFDELSNLLNNELESGKRRPPATLNGNDIPTNVIDYNRVAKESKIQNNHVSSTTTSETNHRREQMKKLAEEIDRTSKHKLQQRREMRIPIMIEKSAETGPKSAPILSQQPRSYEIPVQIENGRRPSLQQERSFERQRTYSEHQSGHTTHEIPIQVEKPTPERFRRAESMFNISDSTTSRQHLHHDDWMKYVGDLGSSENICKPFQREVEICYLGRRPNIRAPRMSASTNDLSNIQTFDTHGAYDVRRTAQTPRPQQAPRRQYLSTQSLIDTTPITPCVSTARRSPAPERRSSLPREIHDKQLQYITSKEQQLKYEFERLENERRHLIDEMNRVQMNQRISREAYRQRQLPPLTEDESFRQQMAEEWLNKVAEREERRLQKIIKISKVNQEAGVPVAPPRRHSAADDIGDEFLRRVKERRSKLCMPSDSDWESGAESHPMPRTDGSRSETDEPPVTVFEGHSAANIKQLPKHLREFAKLTSQMKEEHREEMTENTSTSASKMTSLKTSVKTSSSNNQQQRHSMHESSQSMLQDVFSVKNEYMSEPETEYEKPKKMAQLSRRQYDGIGPTTKHGMPVVLRSEVKEPNQHEWYKRIFQTIHKQKNPDDYVTIRYKCPRGRYPYKANGYMSEPEPNYDSDYSTVKYRTLERRRLQSTGTGTESRTSAGPPTTGNESHDETFYGTMPNPVKSGQGSYKVQPGRIENYITGHSSVSEKEKKEWWDEVMDIFNGQLDQQKLSPHYTEGNLSRALLKEQGYTSDSNLVFRKKDVPILQSPLSPVEQKQVYKSVQAGGQPPLLGFRKPAPEKPKETEFEYLPITPTLTKIRVHSKELVMSKNRQASAERRELLCYPISNIARPIDVFAPFPKNVPSFIPLHQPPMPPNRKSSRVRTNSMALKISSSQVRRPTSANSSRHEACFQTKDAISPPPPPKPIHNKYGTITLRKTVKRTEPLMRSKSAGAVVSILTAAKEEKSRDGRVSRKQQSVRLSSCSPVRSASKLSTFRATSRSPVAFGRSVSKERSFAEEKKRIEESLPSYRADFTASTNILRDPRLKSPDQVKRAVRSYAFPIERSKSAPRVLPPIKPAMSSYVSTYVVRRIPSPPRKDSPKRGQSSTPTRSLTKSPAAIRSKSQSSKLSEKTSSKSLAKTSSTLSLARTSSTFSVDSIAPKSKPVQKKPLSLSRPSSKTELDKPKRKPVTITSSKSDSNVLKKIRESPEIKKKIIKAIPMQQKLVRTNQFFQNLFMRETSPKHEPVRPTSVHDKMRYWNTMSLPPKRTVCDSRTIAYRSLSPPVRPNFVEEYEAVEHFHSDDEDSEFGGHCGRTEDLVWQYEQRSRSEPRPVKTIKPVCDIARPESPAHTSSMREFSPTREIRVPQTREMRSPSRRRIQNFRDSQRGETGKVIRASSLSSADDRSKKSLYNCDEFAHSANSLEYIERHSPSCRLSNSDRFIDLNRFYSTLERVGQLERATSASSLKPIRREGEPLDFEEWRKIRSHERAERELSYLVGKLKEDQKQKDFLFRPKDVEDVKWVGNRDLSLKSKEKSVEDLRENFEKKIHQEWLDENKRLELESKKDTYKPYWRGSSVVDLASNMEIKYNSEKGSYGIQKTKPESSPEKPLCLSNRLISTLSKDQVSKITKQLNEIYNASEPKTKPDITEEYVITVDKPMSSNALKVRCNSSISKEELIGPVLRRKEASEKPAQSKKIELKSDFSEADKKRLSQNFSREIQGKARSSSPIIVGRETRGAIAAENAKLTPHEIPPPPPLPTHLNEPKKPAPPKPKRKPTEDQKMKIDKPSQEQTPESEPTSLETTIDKPDETVSKKIQYFEERRFEESPKTIYHAREDSSPDEDEVMRVIEANIKARAQSGKFYHQEMSSSVTDLKDLFGEKESSRINFPIPRLPPPPDETIYHETKQEQDRSTSLTLRATREGSNEELETLFRSRSVSPQSKETSYLHRVNTGEVRKIKDKFESLGRPKKKKHFFALSPLRKVRSDPELSNDGSKDTLKTIVREHELGDVSWIAHKFEVRQSSGRGRSRVRKPGSPIQRMPIRKEDRLMPHIDIISKTASLKQEMIKSRSPSPARPHVSIHDGGVKHIRSKFETSPDRTSPVGQPRLGTSSPELRDISPHLTASWIAHKFPRPLDNDLRSPPPPPTSLKPEKLAKSDSLPIKEAKRHERCYRYRSRSISPPKSKQKHQVVSILKPRFDFFANQKFDPLIHRPKATYVPDTGDDHNLKKSQSQIGGKKMTAVKFKESPNRYFESDVNIHYKTPIRYEYKDPIPEEELAIRQAETMQKLYQEERRRKYLQELQDMNSRRHTDNFTPSQKSPIPLNRYDDFNSDLAPKSPNTSSNYPRTVARALYNFQGQTARELTFKKGDVIYIRRQIDKNWYEGEHNAMIGLLPSNYVELLTKDGIRQPPKKPSEGQARAKYNFQAQSGIELSLNKGEHVTLTRRVDENWYEGKIANRKGIFPVSYVEVLVDIGAEDKTGGRLPAATQSIITQSSSSMRPSLDTLRTNINNEFNSLTSNGQQPPNGILRETRTLHKTEVLHVDTNTEPVAYRALYKYRPQNTDELELQEGDVVFVLEKCDDGWFVGTSQRSGCFGTFPGNYVERV
ncbi:uncharacterized protein LOC129921182 isoform X4 [Episyrphus balteatus]|uniref:uncharacterized protein LOC129921182 isoform X4 n=1 Tax=Episyrphus balteatus TaxID=286459 RepID=UPI002486BB0B|nr:uncharacterized protein LOC129921182 isoform X4 [Episyrphus balteatus]